MISVISTRIDLLLALIDPLTEEPESKTSYKLALVQRNMNGRFRNILISVLTYIFEALLFSKEYGYLMDRDQQQPVSIKTVCHCQ